MFRQAHPVLGYLHYILFFASLLGTTESGFHEGAKLLASDAKEESQFGDSVAIENNLLVIGSPQDTPNGDGSGFVYVFQILPQI